MSKYGPADRSAASRRPAARWIAALLLLAIGGGGWLWLAPSAQRRVTELATLIDPPSATQTPATQTPAGVRGEAAAAPQATASSGVAVKPPPPAAMGVTAPPALPPPAAVPGVTAGMPGTSAAPPALAPVGQAEKPALPLPAPPPTTAPSFDIVRIGPNGDAVLAGRAAPGSRVEIIDNGKPLAQAQADPQGQWVVLPTAPLSPGGQQLSVASVTPPSAGAPGSRSEGAAPVILMVPPRSAHTAPGAVATAPPAAFALLAPPGGMPRLLQAPDAAGSGKSPAKVGLDVVDYDDHGAIRFAGRAPPHVTVRLYIDERLAGETSADAFGRWMLTPSWAVAEGTHRVRVDQIGIHGEVAARIELPFERAVLAAQDLLGGRAVVQPRQSLWRIARLAYGRGIQYTVIYQANREQIRDANLIYPGQIFAIPAAVAAAP